jgi:hypothetical protein
MVGRARLGQRLDVGVVERRRRLETVEQDPDRAAVSAGADDDAILADEIWASHHAERG